MLRKVGLAIYRGFFWTYERGTWQYDIMVLLILAFIFLTPRGWFSDRPLRAVSPSDVVLLLDGDTQRIYQLSAAVIDTKVDSTLEKGIQRVLSRVTGKSMKITRIEPAVVDAQGQVVSYAVWVRQ